MPASTTSQVRAPGSAATQHTSQSPSSRTPPTAVHQRTGLVHGTGAGSSSRSPHHHRHTSSTSSTSVSGMRSNADAGVTSTASPSSNALPQGATNEGVSDVAPAAVGALMDENRYLTSVVASAQQAYIKERQRVFELEKLLSATLRREQHWQDQQQQQQQQKVAPPSSTRLARPTPAKTLATPLAPESVASDQQQQHQQQHLSYGGLVSQHQDLGSPFPTRQGIYRSRSTTAITSANTPQFIRGGGAGGGPNLTSSGDQSTSLSPVLDQIHNAVVDASFDFDSASVTSAADVTSFPSSTHDVLAHLSFQDAPVYSSSQSTDLFALTTNTNQNTSTPTSAAAAAATTDVASSGAKAIDDVDSSHSFGGPASNRKSPVSSIKSIWSPFSSNDQQQQQSTTIGSGIHPFDGFSSAGSPSLSQPGSIFLSPTSANSPTLRVSSGSPATNTDRLQQTAPLSRLSLSMTNYGLSPSSSTQEIASGNTIQSAFATGVMATTTDRSKLRENEGLYESSQSQQKQAAIVNEQQRQQMLIQQQADNFGNGGQNSSLPSGIVRSESTPVLTDHTLGRSLHSHAAHNSAVSRRFGITPLSTATIQQQQQQQQSALSPRQTQLMSLPQHQQQLSAQSTGNMPYFGGPASNSIVHDYLSGTAPSLQHSPFTAGSQSDVGSIRSMPLPHVGNGDFTTPIGYEYDPNGDGNLSGGGGSGGATAATAGGDDNGGGGSGGPRNVSSPSVAGVVTSSGSNITTNMTSNGMMVGSEDQFQQQQVAMMLSSMSNNPHFLVDKIVRTNDQPASLLLQQQLRYANDSSKKLIFDAIISQSISLMKNRFGNFLMQRVLEFGTPEQISILVDSMKGNILQLSYDRFGCHVVQKAFECTDDDVRMQLLNELFPLAKETVMHKFSCHVWQRVFQVKWEHGIPPRIMQVMHSVLGNIWDQVASDENGSLVVQCIFENCTEEEKRPILTSILKRTVAIALGQWGNWVIQHILDQGAQSDRACVMRAIIDHFYPMSIDQYASKVVEKGLKTAPKWELLEMIDKSILPDPQTNGHPPLLDMMNNQFANYVVQHILHLADPDQREVCIRLIYPHLSTLKTSKYGQRVAAIAEKYARQMNPNSQMRLSTGSHGYSK